MATQTMSASQRPSTTNILATKPTGPQPTPAKPAPKVRPYKDFLTPALHHRFTSAASLVGFASYLLSVWLSEAGLFWRLSPVGFTGIRTLLLFIPCLSVFIVRVANLHFGEKTTTSGVESAYRLVTGVALWHTFAWYAFSAWMFGEIFIWSRAEKSHLGMVDYGRMDERPRLNENPVQLRCHLFWLAACMTGVHFYKSYDRVILTRKLSLSSQSPLAKMPLPLGLLIQQLYGSMVADSITFVFLTSCFGLPVYYGLMRKAAWSYAHTIGRMLFSDIPDQTGRPSGIIHVWTQITSIINASAQIVLLWQISNAAFTICVSQPPLKNGEPLTSELKNTRPGTVPNPNASLINGLRSKREVVKTFAFWELLEVSEFDARRRTIFTEGDSTSDSTWSKICACCLEEIDGIKGRIRKYQEQAIAPLQAAVPNGAPKQPGNNDGSYQQSANGMPKILNADQSVRDKPDLFQKRPSGGLASAASNFAKSHGRSPGAQNPVTPRARKLIEYGTDKVLTKEQQSQLTPAGFRKEANGFAVDFLKTPLGLPFRQTFGRRLLAVIFGVPYGSGHTIEYAARSLTVLAVASLKEDQYGRVATDVPKIMRAMATAVTEIRKFSATLPPSWTDVDFDAGKDRDVGEVVRVTNVLRECLEKLVLSFGEFAVTLGLTAKELREVKDVAGRANEMVQVR